MIAHHGYERPGDGWQTQSCMGARFRPYEIASDALPPAIAAVERHVARIGEALAAHLSAPPAELTYQRKDAWGAARGPLHRFARPQGFDGRSHAASCKRETYTFQFDSIRVGLHRDLKGSGETLAYLRERLAAWKAPALSE